jgi:hypothetical protein
MKYYRVKPEYDNKQLLTKERGIYVNRGYSLIAKELFTVKEWEKICKKHVFRRSLAECVELVEIPKTKVYWFFGARFEI